VEAAAVQRFYRESQVEDFGLSKRELSELRMASEAVYSSGAGRVFIDSLLEDLQLYDEPEDDRALVLHCFAMRVMRKYFSKLVLDSEHRSEVTNAIMLTHAVSEENEDE